MRFHGLYVALALISCAPDGGRQGTATAVTSASTGATTTPDGGTAAETGAGASTGLTSGGATTGGASTGATGDASTLAPTGTDDTSTAATADPGTSTGDPGTTGAAGSSTAGEAVCPPQGELDCSPGPGSGEGDTCTEGETCFRATVQDAIKQLLAERPEWFMHDDMGDLVLEVELYMDTVVERVAATGLCAIRDPNAGDEIAVKFDNDFAENFDILTAAGYARYGEGIYTSTCAPAWF